MVDLVVLLGLLMLVMLARGLIWLVMLAISSVCDSHSPFLPLIPNTFLEINQALPVLQDHS